jgi:uncharacterized protein
MPQPLADHSAALVTIIQDTPWLCDVLRVVRDVGPPGAFVAAGAVRDTVWNALTGRTATEPYGDVDVVYWAETEPESSSHGYEARLRAALPGVDWEVTNQATVHTWHWQAHRLRVPPHRTVAEGLATWPETATAVGVRLTAASELQVLAPLGLDDLFALRLRHNPALVGPDVFRQRVESKRWLQRWPELQHA